MTDLTYRLTAQAERVMTAHRGKKPLQCRCTGLHGGRFSPPNRSDTRKEDPS